MWYLKHDTNELIYQTDSQTERADWWLPSGGGGTEWEVGSADVVIYRTDKQQSPTASH